MSFSNFNIGKNLENLETSEAFDAYARVDVTLGEDEEGNVITVSYPANAADDEGRILTVDMPMCTDTTLARTAAQRIYDSMMSKDQTAFQYQPIQADGALADPSMEFGDSVDVNGVHGGFFTRSVSFGRLMKTTLTAPTDEEIGHEYPYQDAQQRQITRTNKELKSGLYVTSQAITAEAEARQADSTEFRSQLQVQATQIAAKVSQTGGNNSTFGWTLTSTGHTWYAGSRQVMKVTASGLEVTGKITATSGQIGGFTIGSNSIYSNGMSSMSSAQTTGVHVGTDGIKLGQNFKVDTSGNVTANNMTISGTLTVGGNRITAQSLYTGAAQAAANYGSWNSSASTVSANSGTWTTGARNGTDALGKIDSLMVGSISATVLSAVTMVCNGMRFGGRRVLPVTIESASGSSYDVLALGGYY